MDQTGQTVRYSTTSPDLARTEYINWEKSIVNKIKTLRGAAATFLALTGFAIVFGQFDVTTGFADDVEGHKSVKVIVPKLGQIERLGKSDFDDNCAACHGENAAGTSIGPSFVDPVYRPGHHPNQSFVRAVTVGVQAHHWGFGNMPPVEDLKKYELARIVAYVRALQEANGVR